MNISHIYVEAGSCQMSYLIPVNMEIKLKKKKKVILSFLRKSRAENLQVYNVVPGT